MAARGRVVGATLVALLVVGVYGADAGWNERRPDGDHQVRAAHAAGPTATTGDRTDADRAQVAREPETEPWSPPDDVPTPDRLTRGIGQGEPAEDAAPSEEPTETAEPPAETADTAPDGDAPSTATAASVPDPEPTPDPDPEPTPDPDPEPTPDPPVDPEGRMTDLVDALRHDHGAAPLQRSSALDAIARTWARVLADEGALRHNPDVADQVREHYGCCRVAENVVQDSPADVDRAHQQMTESPSHRSNLLDRRHQRIGIGIVIDDQNRLWGVQVFHGS